MPTHTWKSCEREIASFFGSKRTPLSGSNSGHQTHSDCLNDYIYVEAKYRQKHAACALYFDELKKSRAEGKPLVIALKQRYQTDPPWLMIIDPRELFKIAALVKKSRRENPCKLRRKKGPEKTR